MKKKNKLDENQIWTLCMTVIPVVLLMNVGKQLTNHSGTEMIFAAVFGGLGGLLGFTVNYFTSEKSRTIKIFAVLGIIGICSLIIYLTLPEQEPITVSFLN